MDFQSKAQEICDESILPLKSFLQPDEYEIIHEDCISRQISQTFLPSKYLPASLQDGATSIILRGKDEVVGIEYSYLHDWQRETYATKRKLRHAKAQEIGQHIRKLYGKPKAYGYFDETSDFGFMQSDEKEKHSCQIWLKNDITILLCSERTIYIDGIEMSLSYYRLDRVMGDQNQVSFKAFLDGHAANRVAEPKSIVFSLKELVAIDNYRCSKDNLKKFHIILNDWNTHKAKFSKITKRYKGDELANYAIAIANNEAPFTYDTPKDLATFGLLTEAAEQGSNIAMNEIGYALLHCSLGLSQDLDAAQYWFNKATELNEPNAMWSLAKMHLSSLTSSKQTRQDALLLLERCSTLDTQLCGHDFELLSKLVDGDLFAKD